MCTRSSQANHPAGLQCPPPDLPRTLFLKLAVNKAPLWAHLHVCRHPLILPPQPRFKDKGLPTMRQKCSVEWWNGHLQFFLRAHQPRANFALRALSAYPCARKSDGVRRMEWRAGGRREREGGDINMSPHADHISVRCTRKFSIPYFGSVTGAWRCRNGSPLHSREGPLVRRRRWPGILARAPS